MSFPSPSPQPALDLAPKRPTVRLGSEPVPARRTAPYDVEPGFFETAKLWLYGNFKLLFDAPLGHVALAAGPNHHRPAEFEDIERQAEELVLSSQVLVCGIHSPAHQRASVVPLRWGAPRIVVVSGGFYYHLGKNLKDELFRAARLWRYEFDPKTDLVVSRRAPDKLPTYASHNPTLDRLIRLIATHEWPGLRSPEELVRPNR